MKLTFSFSQFLRSRSMAKRRRAVRGRSTQAEALDARVLLAADLGIKASTLAMNVNVDGARSASETRSVINDAGRVDSQRIDSQRRDSAARTSLREANRDSRLSASDALVVTNRQGGTANQLRELGGPSGDRISNAQKENIRQLMVDLNSIRSESEVTPEQISQLLRDLAAVAADATRPSEESVTQLIENTQAAAEDGQFTPA